MKRVSIFVLLGLVLCVPALAADMTATVLEVHDGDTIYVRPDGDGLHPLFARLGLRLRGCDTPELHDSRADVREKAREAREFTRGKLHPGDGIVIHGVKWDKYGGRIDGTVEMDGVDLCRLLIDAGLARPYTGQGAKPW